MEISEIDSSGNINIGFNQPINVPGFLLKPDDSSKGSELLAVSSIDVKSIMDVSFIMNSDAESEETELKYFLTLTEFTSSNVQVNVNFSDPMSISQGFKPDQVLVQIKDKRMFTSTITGQGLK